MSKKERAATAITQNTAKVPRFAGWGLFFGAVIELAIMELSKTPFTPITMTLMIALATNGGICYAFSTYLEKRPTEVDQIVKDYLISMLILNIIFVAAIGAYVG
jgi:hypothetical protein